MARLLTYAGQVIDPTAYIYIWGGGHYSIEYSLYFSIVVVF